MKHWTQQTFMRLFNGKDIRTFNQRRPIEPFPGKYPTRILLRVAKEFWYFGKPSLNAYRAYRRKWAKSPFDYTTIEFDKAGPIYIEGRVSPASPYQQAFNESAWAIYHPQVQPDTNLSWMGYGVKTLGHRYIIGGEAIRGIR